MKGSDLFLLLGIVLVVIMILSMFNILTLPKTMPGSTTFVTTSRPWFGPPHGPPFRVQPGIGPWPPGSHAPHHPHPPHHPSHHHSIPTHVIKT